MLGIRQDKEGVPLLAETRVAHRYNSDCYGLLPLPVVVALRMASASSTPIRFLYLDMDKGLMESSKVGVVVVADLFCADKGFHRGDKGFRVEQVN